MCHMMSQGGGGGGREEGNLCHERGEIQWAALISSAPQIYAPQGTMRRGAKLEAKLAMKVGNGVKCGLIWKRKSLKLVKFVGNWYGFR